MTTIPVTVQCPACQRVWHAATIVPARDGHVKPETVARQIYCRCGQAPPMRVVKDLPLLEASA